jgi:hypothetical protein
LSKSYREKQRNSNIESEKQNGRKVIPLSLVKRVPKTQLLPGTIVWAHVPYADGTGEKARPALIIGTRGRDIELLPGTTSDRRFALRTGYVEIQDLDCAGLHRKTGINLNPVIVDQIEIISISGSLGSEDAHNLGVECPKMSVTGHSDHAA